MRKCSQLFFLLMTSIMWIDDKNDKKKTELTAAKPTRRLAAPSARVEVVQVDGGGEHEVALLLVGVLGREPGPQLGSAAASPVFTLA